MLDYIRITKTVKDNLDNKKKVCFYSEYSLAHSCVYCTHEELHEKVKKHVCFGTPNIKPIFCPL